MSEAELRNCRSLKRIDSRVNPNQGQSRCFLNNFEEIYYKNNKFIVFGLDDKENSEFTKLYNSNTDEKDPNCRPSTGFARKYFKPRNSQMQNQKSRINRNIQNKNQASIDKYIATHQRLNQQRLEGNNLNIMWQKYKDEKRKKYANGKLRSQRHNIGEESSVCEQSNLTVNMGSELSIESVVVKKGRKKESSFKPLSLGHQKGNRLRKQSCALNLSKKKGIIQDLLVSVSKRQDEEQRSSLQSLTKQSEPNEEQMQNAQKIQQLKRSIEQREHKNLYNPIYSLFGEKDIYEAEETSFL